MPVNNSVTESRMVNIFVDDDPNNAIAVVNASFSEGRYMTVNVTVLDAEKVARYKDSVTKDAMDAIEDALEYAGTKNLPVEGLRNETV